MKTRKGITLIELILALALVSVVIILGFNFLKFGTIVQSKSSSEVEVQSSMRLMSEHINKTIRFATKAHTIPKSSFQYSQDGVRDPITSYIGVTKEGHVVIDEPGENPEDPRVIQYIAKNDGDTKYEIEFYPVMDDSGKMIDKLLGYTVIGIREGKRVNQIKSEVEVLNALNIEHLGTSTDPAVALGYSMEKPGSQKWEKVSPEGYVTLVLDLSGSMKWGMDGPEDTTTETRIDILKDRAEIMIDKLASLDFNVYVSLVPFSNHANNPGNFKNVNTDKGRADIIKEIKSFNAQGATNTGDGMRRAFHQLKDKTQGISSEKNITQHMMILVDGGTTHETREMGWFSYDLYTGREDVGGFIRSTEGRIFGIDPDRYVEKIGDLIKAYKMKPDEDQAIKTFVVGFSNRKADHSSLEKIGKATNAEKFNHGDEVKPYILAKDADELDFAFEQFVKEVENNLWLIDRPKLRPND